jgi:hypothetical protein
VAPGETLILVNIANAEGRIILQTIWATAPHRRQGHRRTDIEDVGSEGALLTRLRELAPLLLDSRPSSRCVAIAMFDATRPSGSAAV